MLNALCQEAAAGAHERRKATASCPVSVDMESLRGEIASLRGVLDTYLEGFPVNRDGKPDVEGHRRYHDSLIEQSKARTEFWRKLTFELAKWGLIGFAAWSLRELWIALLHGPGR